MSLTTPSTRIPSLRLARRGLLLSCLLLAGSALLLGQQKGGNAPAKPAAKALPQPGKITGIIMDYDSKAPASGVRVFVLVPKGEPGADGWRPVDDPHVETSTAADGVFAFDKLDPRKYNLMAERKVSVTSFTSKGGVVRHEDGKPVEVDVAAGQTVELGKVWVQFR